MSIKLSICIPTYNRAAFIGETLESIFSQSTDEIEIVISDNASIDNTEEIVREYQKNFPRITYFRWSSNQGADRNYLKVIELAKSEYCWLMGSDDALMPGAIDRLLYEFRFDCDIYLCNRVLCDFYLKPISQQNWLVSETNDRFFDFKNSNDMKEYVQLARSIGALFSYLSSIVVKRSAWCEVAFDDTFIGTAYAHVYILMSLVSSGATLKYIREPLVLCRGGNDSFATEGEVKRFLIDLNGYEKLAYGVVDSTVRRDFLKVMTFQHSFFCLIKIRAMTTSYEWLAIEMQLKKFGFAQWKIVFAGQIGRLKPFILTLLYLKRRLFSM